MPITAQRLLTELGNKAWSGFNKDDMIWGNEDAITAQTELNTSIRYLINLEDFPFKETFRTITSKPNQSNYSMPDGQIKCIVDNENQKVLRFLGNGETLDKEINGEPEGYYVTYNALTPTLKLYPRPQEEKKYTITYTTYYPVIAQNDDLQMEFINADDYMNIPANLEHLFMDCVVLRTMATNNKDQQDENYVPTLNEFAETWRLFIEKANPVDTETYIIW